MIEVIRGLTQDCEVFETRVMRGISTRLFLCLLLCMASARTGLAQSPDPDPILIRNVRLIDRDRDAEDVVVHILIKKKKLELVTKDRIPAARPSWSSTPRAASYWEPWIWASPPAF